MSSNVIKLGDYTMDEQDRMLRELLGHPPLADDGFSERVVRRVRRQALVSRWLLPAAFAAGALIAAQPAIGLLVSLAALLESVPGSMPSLPALPGVGALLSGVAIAAAAGLSVRLLED